MAISVLLLVLFLTESGNIFSITLDDTRYDECAFNEYFNIATLACVPCDPTGTENKITDDTILGANNYIIACKCATGFIRVENDCSTVSKPFLNLTV